MNSIKRGICWLVVVLFLVGFIPPVQAAGYAWVLVSKIDYPGSTDADRYNKTLIYRFDIQYSPSSYAMRITYIGEDTEFEKDVKIESGETLAVIAVVEGIPDVINAGEPVELRLNQSVMERFTPNLDLGEGPVETQVYFAPVNATLDGENAGMPRFTDTSGADRFSTGMRNGDHIYSDLTLSAELGEGELGQQVALVTRTSFQTATVATYYIYEWQKSLSTTTELNGMRMDFDSSRKIEVPKDADGNYIDSGIRFNNLSGEVLIRRGDDPLGWEFVELDSIIYEGDIIKTKHYGEVEFSFPDMTIFKMLDQSATCVLTKSEEESKIDLINGKVWANVKRMIKDGSMEVEMSQAVAGIKGTIFICESDDEVSTVKVLEGEVEVTDLKGNQVVIGPGESVTARDGTVGTVEEFSIQEELSLWPEEVRTETEKEIAARNAADIGEDEAAIEKSEEKAQLPSRTIFVALIIGVILFIAVAAVGVLVLLFFLRSRKKTV